DSLQGLGFSPARGSLLPSEKSLMLRSLLTCPEGLPTHGHLCLPHREKHPIRRQKFGSPIGSSGSCSDTRGGLLEMAPGHHIRCYLEDGIKMDTKVNLALLWMNIEDMLKRREKPAGVHLRG
ncbi:RIKEN cDNA C130026L21, isoform CRA_a, partial [Mus musculus]